MKNWEYHVSLWDSNINQKEVNNLNEHLDELGAEGWELVSIVPQLKSDSNTEFQVESVQTASFVITMKRELVDILEQLNGL